MLRLARPVAATRVVLSALCLCGAPLAANRNLHVENLSRSRWTLFLDPKEETKEDRSPVVTLEFRHGVPGRNPCVVEGDTVRILGDSWDPPAHAPASGPVQAARGLKRPSTVPGAPASQALRLLTLTNQSDATWTVAFTQEPGPGRQGLWRYKAGRAVQVRPRIEVVLPVAQSYRLPPHAVRFLPLAPGETPLALRIWDASSRTPRGFLLTADPDAGFTLRQDAGAAEETLIRRTLRIEPGGATLATAAWDPDLVDALEGTP